MKKIRINLYTEEFRPKKVILSLEHMIIIWLASAIIVGISYYVTYQQKVKLQQEENALMEEISQINDTLMKTQSLVAEFSPDGALTDRANNLKALYDAKKELHDILVERSKLKNNGYAGFMESMASIKGNNIAIKEFKIDGINADIKGYARKGADVPKWVTEFRKYSALSPIIFGGASIKLDEETNIVEFTLDSRLKDDVIKEEKKVGN